MYHAFYGFCETAPVRFLHLRFYTLCRKAVAQDIADQGQDGKQAGDVEETVSYNNLVSALIGIHKQGNAYIDAYAGQRRAYAPECGKLAPLDWIGGNSRRHGTIRNIDSCIAETSPE